MGSNFGSFCMMWPCQQVSYKHRKGTSYNSYYPDDQTNMCCLMDCHKLKSSRGSNFTKLHLTTNKLSLIRLMSKDIFKSGCLTATKTGYSVNWMRFRHQGLAVSLSRISSWVVAQLSVTNSCDPFSLFNAAQ